MLAIVLTLITDVYLIKTNKIGVSYDFLMNIRDRLDLAHENVAYGADKTWSRQSNSMQTSNMDLFLKKSHIQIPKPVELRPRTVRDCIPDSKLAQYSNYEYSNSRELSYTSEDFRKLPDTSYDFKDEFDKEPWMMDEVDEYFKYFMENQKQSLVNKEIFSSCAQFQSPFMNCNSLPEYFLKLQVTKDQVKKLWDAENVQTNSYMFRSLQSVKGEKSLIVYKSPAGQIFVSEYDGITRELTEDYCEWDKHFTDPDDSIDSLNILSHSFKQTNKKSSDEIDGSLNAQTDSSGSRRLYSAVLQGYTPKNLSTESDEGKMTILRRNVSKSERSVMEKLGNVGDYQKQIEHILEEDDAELPKSSLFSNAIPKLFTTRSIKSSRSVQTVQATSDVGINSNIPTLNLDSQYRSTFQNRITHTSFSKAVPPVIHPQSITPKINRQNYSTSNYQYPPLCMLLQNSLQQLYTPVVHQRTIPTLFNKSIPHRSFQMPMSTQYNNPSSTGFVPRGQMSQRFDNSTFRIRRKESKSKMKVESFEKRKASRKGGCSVSNIRKINGARSFSSLASQSDHKSTTEQDKYMDELVSRTVDLVLNETDVLPISRRQSDELEREALEQYINSCEEDFQELERQAAEEYENCSENCKSPPNLEASFGGFLTTYKFCFIF
ncbi:unnamed protein product [Phaedon cochleariae]|uniref:Uncharacterized protein n=1 Tax=Phaedon cochleariae TaxID=80249 RepID=A0A9P0GLU4_PHACE|nr:unnamed protein product [Phaedon cochleariae]